VLTVPVPKPRNCLLSSFAFLIRQQTYDAQTNYRFMQYSRNPVYPNEIMTRIVWVIYGSDN
jgi:hypothetical protein